MTVIVASSAARALEDMGFRRVATYPVGHEVLLDSSGEVAILHREFVALAVGRRTCPRGALFLDHAAVEPFLDPRDRGSPCAGPGAKGAIAWSPFLRHPERWVGKGLPPDVERMMTDGVTIDTVGDDASSASEVSQYAFRDAEHFVRGTQECDRALVCGHLEAVPADEAAWALENGCVHPWTVVHQSADKWRSCQDYKMGTNLRVVSQPFTLCSAHEVSQVVGPDSHFAKFDLRDGFWSVPVARGSRHHLMVRHPATGRLLRCTSLPFGYAKSPQHFCRMTEAVAALFRSRVAGLGIHIFCFVDDYLIVGDSEELTRQGMHVFADLLQELGLEYSPLKTRGPARVMEFLGFLLCNTPDFRCISLTSKRQTKLLALIDEWAALEPSAGQAALRVEPVPLASLLGQLVFSSEVIPGSRVYMQAMLSQFRGLEVDWARGLVRHVSSAWTRVQVAEGFWRDLHWWRSALQRQNCLPFARPVVGEIAIVGTDASDYACGELIWLDGGREETVLVFTSAERRRPINFRELRGTLRALELWGARLRGRLVLVETDNTVGHESLRQLRSRAEDMQELVRRIHELSLEHGFSIRSVHTPGVMLIRPDQTSRGASPEEPRLRLSSEAFGRLESRYGPFDEFLGPERELVSLSPSDVEGRLFRRLWAHPTFDTVGSTLRLICDRLTSDPGSCPRGVVVVPWAPEAGWWKLVRHFCVVGRWGAGELGMSANVEGVWHAALSQRPTILLAFPRAGSMLVPLIDAVLLGTESSRAELATCADRGRLRSVWVNEDSPLPPGTLLYAPRRVSPADVAAGGRRGVGGTLYELSEFYHGGELPRCAELLRLHSGNRHHYARDRASWRKGLGGALEPWRPAVESLWVVNHLGGRLLSQPATSGRDRSVRYVFDFDRAEAEIERLGAALARADDVAAGVHLSEEVDGEGLPRDAGEGTERSPSVASAAASVASDFEWISPSDMVGLSGSDAEGADADESLLPMSGYADRTPPPADAARALRSRALAPDSGAPSGDLGGTRRRLGHSDTPGEPSPHRPAAPAPAAGVIAPSRCRYAAQLCAGCRQEMGLDAWIIPGGLAMVHNDRSCYRDACVARDEEAARVFEEALRARAASASLQPGSRLGPVVPGAVVDECEACVPGEVVSADGVDELGPSREFTLMPPPRGSRPPAADANQRVTQMHENLSDARRSMVRCCLDGLCAHAGTSEPSMTCVGSCHRQLHGVACAQLSHGHAVLGVFQCPDCRLRVIFQSDGPYPETARKNIEETMLHELSRGAEGTGAGYADFTKLEAEWALHVGQGATVLMPSDSAEALKCFLTWLVREKERARSLPSLWRLIGSYQLKTFRPNLTGPEHGVKAHYVSLLDSHGIEEHPRTSATPRMLRHCIGGGVIARHCTRPILRARTELDIGLEAGHGLRVGEALTGGDFHGLKANHLTIIRHRDTGLVQVEGMLEHSKTKHKRFVNCLGTTVGHAQLDLARICRDYWRESGMAVSEWDEGAYRVTGVDYSVVRVSFLGMTAAQFRLLGEIAAVSAVAELRTHSKATLKRASDRYSARHSKDKRYVNLVGGPSTSKALSTLVFELTRAGLGQFASVVPGPLLRATDGHYLSHMPLDPSSTYGKLHEIMDEAYELSNPTGDPDPWLDLQGLETPLWGHHSWRRLADTVARASMAKTGVTEQDIDIVFGWQENMYSQRMQYHYETRFNREKRYRVTMYL